MWAQRFQRMQCLFYAFPGFTKGWCGDFYCAKFPEHVCFSDASIADVLILKQNAAHEPECSHVKHFCETSDLNSLVHFSPVAVPVHCRLWNPEEGGVESVGCEGSGVLSGEPATQNDFWHVMKHVGMSQSATPAMRNKATRRLKPPKVTNLAKLAIGAAMRASRERLRTVAQRLANTASTPRPPERNGNPCYAFGTNERISTLKGHRKAYVEHLLHQFALAIFG